MHMPQVGFHKTAQCLPAARLFGTLVARIGKYVATLRQVSTSPYAPSLVLFSVRLQARSPVSETWISLRQDHLVLKLTRSGIGVHNRNNYTVSLHLLNTHPKPSTSGPIGHLPVTTLPHYSTGLLAFLSVTSLSCPPNALDLHMHISPFGHLYPYIWPCDSRLAASISTYSDMTGQVLLKSLKTSITLRLFCFPPSGDCSDTFEEANLQNYGAMHD
ncbi:unnamed protein product [Somion occarium]|uniref:Uncharacterized protein n=1 Tax=Somion occarium TaxID=3059160 RepID=A0ABP1DXG1_9APHY